MKKIAFLYLYGCGGREDKLNFAVSAIYEDHTDHPAETIALFRSPGDAASFAYNKQEKLGCMVHLLPSFDTDAVRFAGISYVPTEDDKVN